MRTPLSTTRHDLKRKRQARQRRVSIRSVPPPVVYGPHLEQVVRDVVIKTSETKKHSHERIEKTLSSLGGLEYQSLVSLGQGAGAHQRIGHKVRAVGIDVRGHVNNNTTAAGILRLLVIRHKNASANPSSDLLETDVANQDPTTGDVSAIWRRVNGDSYEILGQRYLTLDSAEKSFKTFQVWIPLKRTLNYETSSALVPTEDRISLVAFCRATGNDGLTMTTELHYVSTLYFKDL